CLGESVTPDVALNQFVMSVLLQKFQPSGLSTEIDCLGESVTPDGFLNQFVISVLLQKFQLSELLLFLFRSICPNNPEGMKLL
ncbi:hypothetical protein, partial [Dyadobacter bucti]|uniref:hypothetical protein n=1 Tax=Dyadobacter bucti TaxID=2572203 RepID=UPI003F724A41